MKSGLPNQCLPGKQKERKNTSRYYKYEFVPEPCQAVATAKATAADKNLGET